jgi:hypothetical protein
MRPKFSVGEVIILKSKDFPECNGEYTVIEIKEHSLVGWIYKLDVYHHVEGKSDFWCESALRKKYTPGEMSFDSLMHSLSSPKLLTHQPQ